MVIEGALITRAYTELGGEGQVGNSESPQDLQKWVDTLNLTGRWVEWKGTETEKREIQRQCW